MAYGRSSKIEQESKYQRFDKELKQQATNDIKIVDIDKINEEINTVYYQEHPEEIPPWDAPVKMEQPKINKEPKKRNKFPGKIIINQSLIKKLIDKYQNEVDFCPKYIKECVMDRNCEQKPTNAMLAGKFFESLVLGSTTDSKAILDLPRKKLTKKRIEELKAKGLPLIGDKKIDQIRIEEQAERAKRRFEELGIEVYHGINTHQTIYKKWSDRYILSGELDLFPTPILYNGIKRLAIIDLKLTADVHSTFGSFCWGKPQYMDHLQGDMYHYLIRDIDFDLNPNMKEIITPKVQELIEFEEVIFLYWVWGYKKEPLEEQEIFLERTYRDESGTDFRQKELQERIRKAIAIIEREETFGWEPKPVHDQCINCPHAIKNGGTCKLSVITKV